MAYDELSNPITVTEANTLVKNLLDESFYQITIKGEIAGIKHSSSGHVYFSLKDSASTLSCAIFRSQLLSIYDFKEGDSVIAIGRITTWVKSGSISFNINKMYQEGEGELKALLEKRKLYYQNLGWFDPIIKKKLPETINTIGVITSPTGAVIHDILDVTQRRAPRINIILFPSAVQGKGAEDVISSRIRQANNFDNVDVLIVGRGGGSLEDLAPFSEDEVIIAIHNSHIPVISAVGHEVDWALSDYVADVRAGTPSIAAEIVTQTEWDKRSSLKSVTSSLALEMKNIIYKKENMVIKREILSSLIKEKISYNSSRIKDHQDLLRLIERKVENSNLRIAFSLDSADDRIREKIRDATAIIEGYIEYAPYVFSNKYTLFKNKILREKEKSEVLLKDKCDTALFRFSLASSDVPSSLDRKIQNNSNRVIKAKETIEILISKKIKEASLALSKMKDVSYALSFHSALERGYSLVRSKEGKIIRDVNEVQIGETISIEIINGQLKAKTIDKGETK